MKKKIVLLFLIILMLIGLTGCGKKTVDDMIKESVNLDWKNLSKVIEQNKAVAEDLNGHIYYFVTTVKSIEEDHCKVDNDNPIEVYLDTETLKSLALGEQIVVVGKLEDVQGSPKLMDAIKLDDDTIKNNFIFGLIETNGPGRKNKCRNYVVNPKTNLVTSYISSSGEHTLTYDANGNLIEDSVYKSTLYGIEITTYTYNADNTVATESITKIKDGVTTPGNIWNYTYERDDKNRVIKERSVNISSDDKYTMVYEYEYDENDRVAQRKEISPTSTYIVKYEYDKFGNKIRETASKINEPYSEMVTTHTYEIIAKKNN